MLIKIHQDSTAVSSHEGKGGHPPNCKQSSYHILGNSRWNILMFLVENENIIIISAMLSYG